MSQSPDLRVLFRRLTTTSPSQLPHSIPSFINHVLRCKDVFSSPQDPKAKTETATLVPKVKSIITNLLNGKRAPERFTGVVLAKAVIDVGGWECLRESHGWVRSLLAILQKNNPYVVKELCVVALVRIYTLVNEYQTLNREIGTETLPAFFKACLSLIKPPPSGQRLKAPFSVVEAILDAFSTLQPLYPTTSRPFNGEIRTAIRSFLVPTSSDDGVVPRSLQRASRRLSISLHFTTTGKTGPGDDWAKQATELLADFHGSADQVFRAVQESWEPLIPRTKASVSFDAPPQANDAADGLPGWKGVRAGSERLIGLLHFLADMLRYPTKTPVSIPVGLLMEVVHRVAQISKPSKSQSWEQALETHPAVAREEKEELWSCMPSIHIASLDLLHVLYRRLQQNALSLVPESLDSILLILKSGIESPPVRTATYTLMSTIVAVSGPGLSKSATDAMGVVMLACCRDLQQDAGHLAEPKPQANAAAADTKKNGMVANADLFLPKKQGDGEAKPVKRTVLSRKHRNAAEVLLAGLLTHLPQRQLKPGIRGLLDQTAILAQNRDAMLASVLNPYVNEAGKSYPSILPHLSRRFPYDQGVEVLRSNIRASLPASADDLRLAARFEELDEEGDDDEVAAEIEAQLDNDGDHDMNSTETRNAGTANGPGPDTVVITDTETTSAPPKERHEGPFLPRQESSIEVTSGPTTAQKRKHEAGAETTPPLKKQETETKAPVVPVVVDKSTSGADDSDDESVHLNMDLDDLEDDEDDE